MYLLSIYCMSDVAMGDGNPQISVSLYGTRGEAEQGLVGAYNEGWAFDEDDPCYDDQPKKSSFEEVAALFDGASLPETPTFEIQEIGLGQKIFLHWYEG